MVISFEEKDRAAIEARGMTIIQFKQRLYKMAKSLDDAWHVLKECVNKVADAICSATEIFAEAIDKAQMVIEVIKDVYNYPTSSRYKIVKAFSKCTGTSIYFGWGITWRIKRLLARSCI